MWKKEEISSLHFILFFLHRFPFFFYFYFFCLVLCVCYIYISSYYIFLFSPQFFYSTFFCSFFNIIFFAFFLLFLLFYFPQYICTVGGTMRDICCWLYLAGCTLLLVWWFVVFPCYFFLLSFKPETEKVVMRELQDVAAAPQLQGARAIFSFYSRNYNFMEFPWVQ